jgi:hypothetical protein
MIKLGDNLKEMWDLHFDHKCPEDILMYISYIYFNDACELQRPMDLGKMRKIFRDDLFGAKISLNSFSSHLGGNVYLCETVEDLKEISTSISTAAGDRWLSLYEAADSFDVCEWMFPDNAMVFLVMIWNDSGGPAYFIPKDVANQCMNVAASINATKGFWESNVNQKDKPA